MPKSFLAAAILLASASLAWSQDVRPIDMSSALPIDETYRGEFRRCDLTDQFRGFTFPIINKKYEIVWYGCHRDNNNVQYLLRFLKKEPAREAIYFSSKLGIDLDGSWIACERAGLTDQCPTSLMLSSTATTPCVLTEYRGEHYGRDRCVPVDSDKIPYVVMPAAGPKGSPAREFRNRTGVRVGDYGVVVYKGATVPIIVADAGPFNKLGEGSMALHRQLGNDVCAQRREDGVCIRARAARSLPAGVVTVIFPGTADDPRTLLPEMLASVVEAKADAYLRDFLSAYGQ